MKLQFERWQRVKVTLLREPTNLELLVLNGKTTEVSLFDLPDDLIDWETEEIIEEDYSQEYSPTINKPKYIEYG